jgi:hypothetical protein
MYGNWKLVKVNQENVWNKRLEETSRIKHGYYQFVTILEMHRVAKFVALKIVGREKFV